MRISRDAMTRPDTEGSAVQIRTTPGTLSHAPGPASPGTADASASWQRRFRAGCTLGNPAWQPWIALAPIGVTVAGRCSSSRRNVDTDCYRPGRHTQSGLLGTS